MLRGMIICPDEQLRNQVEDTLIEVGNVRVAGKLNDYPNAYELVRQLRTQAPHVVFLSVESRTRSLDTAARIEAAVPGTQVVAVSRDRDSDFLLQALRSGVREFLFTPFKRRDTEEALIRISQLLARRPPAIESTDQVFAFLPAKPGVGASTIAVNTSLAMSRRAKGPVLLADGDLYSGIVSFLLKLDGRCSILDAAERGEDMDENLWRKLISSVEALDVLPSARLAGGQRLSPLAVRNILGFTRRIYKAICVDLAGDCEDYSLEVMQEAKQIFIVTTPETSALRLAKEKLAFLTAMDLGAKVRLIMNRAPRRYDIPVNEIERMIGMSLYAEIPNDYGVARNAAESGKPINQNTSLGRSFVTLSGKIMDDQTDIPMPKRRFVEYFSVIPTRNPFARDAKERKQISA